MNFKKSKSWKFVVRISQGGRLYGNLIYVVMGILLSFLVIDSIFCAVDSKYSHYKILLTAFYTFTYILMIFGIALTIAWPIVYLMLRYEIN